LGNRIASSNSHDVEHFERWAATYDRSVLQVLFFGPVHAQMLDLVDGHGPTDPPGCLVDVGCGTGRLLRLASVRWPEAQLTGIDPSEAMLSEARRHNPSADFKVGLAEALPFPDESADLVLSSISFHHWVDHPKAVREIARVLRPGGWFCLADHIFLPTRLTGERVQSPGQIRALMSGAGLEIRGQKFMFTRFTLITLAQK
jgi:ubiquinone/menaquinone biosynthesis C-methylase UbiE